MKNYLIFLYRCMRETFIGVMPFFVAELLRVALLLAFPAITLWLPRYLSG